MKRMVKKAGDLDKLADVIQGEDNGNLKVDGTIIASGEIRAGDVSASKFLLGTEEMPLVKANPAGDATGTLEKIKIGDVAYKVGGGSGERELTLIAPYSKESLSNNKKINVDDETFIKIAECYYETIKIYFNDGNPLGIFNVLSIHDNDNKVISRKYLSSSYNEYKSSLTAWFGKNITQPLCAFIQTGGVSGSQYIQVSGYQPNPIPDLDKAKFDALYKLADKPTQDGTYVLKATVSGGAVTYTWEPQA